MPEAVGGREAARVLAVAACALAAAPPALAQEADGLPVARSLVEEVLPGATSFEVRNGDPRVIVGLAADTVVGYAFLTSDAPPEELGYNAPIEVLVGMDPEGVLAGVRVVRYAESYMSTRGDFLRAPGYEAQFAGKSIDDPFRAKRDVRVVSRATISVAAMSRGIRASARRVYAAHLAPRPTAESGGSLLSIGMEELDGMSWSGLAAGGFVPRIRVIENGVARIALSFAHIRSDSVGETLIGGRAFGEVAERIGARAREDHLMLVGVDGALALLFYPSTLSMVQDADTLRMDDSDVWMLGEPGSGMVRGQFRNVGVMAVPGSLDVRRPFDIRFDLRPGMGLYSTEYPPPRRAETVAARGVPAGAPTDSPAPPMDGPEAAAESEPAERTTESPGVGDVAAESAEAARTAASGEGSAPTDDAVSGAPPTAPALDFSLAREQTVLERTLERTSPAEVAWMLGLLALASAAFLLKREPLRWAALAATFLHLGWFDGGFLSVSHIVAAVSVGPAVFLEDVPLLLLVVFTATATLLAGRVFCGFLCPFGALQDFLERAVPKRFARQMPRALHKRLWGVKYVFLAAILVPALAGSRVSVFPFLEPFGTVFFLSSSLVLWGIAGAVLAASAVVPRFYCRYACPLGAALAVASAASPFRIRRVDHCAHCKVCERACPTGAVEGPRVHFRECVRCNVCERKLIERAGVCRHDVRDVRRRLVQLKTADSGTGASILREGEG